MEYGDGGSDACHAEWLQEMEEAEVLVWQGASRPRGAENMKIHQKAGIICIAAMFTLGYNIFFISRTIVEAQGIITNFFIGFIGGITWLLVVLFDPKSKYSIKKKEVLRT